MQRRVESLTQRATDRRGTALVAAGPVHEALRANGGQHGLRGPEEASGAPVLPLSRSHERQSEKALGDPLPVPEGVAHRETLPELLARRLLLSSRVRDEAEVPQRPDDLGAVVELSVEREALFVKRPRRFEIPPARLDPSEKTQPTGDAVLIAELAPERQ